MENDFLNLYKVLFLILFLTFLASISSLIKIKFKTLEQEVVFSGILTFLVELGIILYLFHSYTFYFISLFKREFKRSFLIGILLYFFLIPILSVLTLFIFYIFKKAKIEPSPQKIIFLYLKIKSIPILVFLFC
ncbi:MAG: hypothetical protein NC926_04715 [Candidatus Omnitrophica bacterium]|nr:hypothetical protein [Candidatus Omnitrophota bacterium]